MNQTQDDPTSPFRFSLAWLLGYIAVIGLVCGGLFYARQQALNVYGSPEAKVEWEEWRKAAKEMSQGPVARRVPTRAEPPALLLMRDRFVACLLTAVLLTSVLFGTLMVFVRGALTSGARIGSSQKSRE